MSRMDLSQKNEGHARYCFRTRSLDRRSFTPRRNRSEQYIENDAPKPVSKTAAQLLRIPYIYGGESLAEPLFAIRE
jgi:hypothetical protein